MAQVALTAHSCTVSNGTYSVVTDAGANLLKTYGITDITADEYAQISIVTILDEAMTDFGYLADALKKDNTPEDYINAVFDRLKMVRNKEALEAGIELKP